MNDVTEDFDFTYFCEIVTLRCGEERFLRLMHISRSHFVRLAEGKSGFRQDEMLRAAEVLRLDEEEFIRCFFYSKSSEILNL